MSMNLIGARSGTRNRKILQRGGKNFGSAGEVYLKSLGSAIGYYKAF